MQIIISILQPRCLHKIFFSSKVHTCMEILSEKSSSVDTESPTGTLRDPTQPCHSRPLSACPWPKGAFPSATAWLLPSLRQWGSSRWQLGRCSRPAAFLELPWGARQLRKWPVACGGCSFSGPGGECDSQDGFLLSSCAKPQTPSLL